MRLLRPLLLLGLAACGADDPRPNVLVISIDTLRADRLGCYGYERDTSPALDRFAREHAVRFEQAVAESPWTLPSHVTLLSGLHPLTHGVRLPDQAPSDEVELLAETLREAGYRTFALTDGGWLSAPWGLARGFESFEAAATDLADTVADARRYIEHLEGRGPWFGFLHTYDVHCPYDPPEPFFSAFADPAAEPIEVAGRCGNPHYNALELTDGQVRYLSDRYDGGVLWIDTALAELFAFLDERELWDDTIVVVTSDHGEELGEHGRIGHERTLHAEALHVPLLIAAPGVAPATPAGLVGLADVVPTVLELVGVEPRARLDGRSLVPWLRGDALPQDVRLSELAWKEELVSRTEARDHAILDRATGRVRLYDRLDDPREAHDRCADDPDRCRALEAELSAEVRDRLRRTLPTRTVEGR